MAILGIFTGKGIPKMMYDSLRPEVNWEKGKESSAGRTLPRVLL